MNKQKKSYKDINLPNGVTKDIFANDKGDYVIKIHPMDMTVGLLKEILKDIDDDKKVLCDGSYPTIYISDCPYENAISFEDYDVDELENCIDECKKVE